MSRKSLKLEGDFDSNYRGKRVLVTGGAGFVGSNLTHRLVRAGAVVTVVDNFHKDYGGNEFNLQAVQSQIRLVRGDITNRELMRELVHSTDIVFHIAAQCSHVDSMIDPWLDVSFNCEGTLAVLEAAKGSPSKPAVVYAGTRAMVGAPLQLPVVETTLPNPTDVYGVNKLAAELYGSVYARVHKVPFVSLRLTNCFGPYHQMKSGKYGILNWFISLGLQQKPITIYGTGQQLRDYLYIDDAIDVFMRAGLFSKGLGEGSVLEPEVQLSGEKIPFAVFNVASGNGIAFGECAKFVAERSSVELKSIPWPADRAAIETGDFICDIAAIDKVLGWKPTTSFQAGLDATFAFYRQNLRHYL